MKNKKRKLIVCIIAFVIVSFFSVYRVKADTVYETDVTEPSEGNEIVGVSGWFEYVEKSVILNRINEIRKEAYEEGLVDKYVPMKWSYDLEYEARLLVVDYEFVRDWSERANGGSVHIKHNGVDFSNAWHVWSKDGLMAKIEQFYEAKNEYASSGEEAHVPYKDMINPDYTCIAIASFKPDCYEWRKKYDVETNYGITWLFSSESGVNEEQYKENNDMVVQKIEIKDSYISGLSLTGSKTMDYGTTQDLVAKYEVSIDNEYETETGVGHFVESAVVSAYGVTWSSSKPSVATVDSNGKVKAVKAGKTNITAKYGSYSKSLTIEVGHDINGASITNLFSDYKYYDNGKAITQTLIMEYGDDLLFDGVDFDATYKNNKKVGTATVTITGKKNFYGTVSKTFKIVKPVITYSASVQKEGQLPWVGDGSYAGTKGKGLRLELIRIQLKNAAKGDGLWYRTYVQKKGWTTWADAGETSGMKDRRLEAFQLKLHGMMTQYYDIYYRVYAQRFGWMGWAKNGQSAGTAGYGYRLEGVQIKLIPKNGQKPLGSKKAFQKKG